MNVWFILSTVVVSSNVTKISVSSGIWLAQLLLVVTF